MSVVCPPESSLPIGVTCEPLALKHQDLLQPLLIQQQLEISEFSFSNLYLFRSLQGHALKVILTPRFSYIHGRTRENLYYLMPTSLEAAQDQEMLALLSPHYHFIFPIPDSWLSQLNLPGQKQWILDADSDYLFTLEKLLYYPGRELSSRRNLVHQFMSKYDCQSVPLTSFNSQEAHKVLDIWQKETGLNDKNSDYLECKEALELLEHLGLDGEIYYIDQKPVAFLIGEMLTSQMFVIHFLKADRLYKGIYQYIYQAFAKELLNRASWVNLEQDAGFETLRKAKMAYHPDKMGIKWRVDWSRQM